MIDFKKNGQDPNVLHMNRQEAQETWCYSVIFRDVWGFQSISHPKGGLFLCPT
jgi:hypothetical protein